ncbi:MAG: protein kinase [Eubacterium sp.]|nr:protein kinase [Eubacterium sp.]
MNRMCSKCNNIFQIPKGHENEDFCCPYCGNIEGPGMQNLNGASMDGNSAGGSENNFSSSALPMGTVLANEYIIESILGQGGFGITYKAADRALNIKVAIKEYFPRGVVSRIQDVNVTLFSGADTEMFENGKVKFMNEARSLASLNGYKGTANVLNFFEANGTAYIVMEYIEGRKLQDYMQDGYIMSRAQFESTACQLCDILDMVHSKGIIHRDISPDNVVICSDGTFKLLDFGAVKVDYSNNQQSSQIVLKHGYAPIEQFSKNSKIGPWTDVYAIGVILYKALTGTLPQEVVDRIVEDQVVPAYMLNPNISLELSDVIMKAIALYGEHRYQSAKELKAALMNVLRPAVALLPPAQTGTLGQVASGAGNSGVGNSGAGKSGVITAPSQTGGRPAAETYGAGTMSSGVSETGTMSSGVSGTGTMSSGVSGTGTMPSRAAGSQKQTSSTNKTPVSTETDNKRKLLIAGLAAAAVLFIVGCIVLIINLRKGAKIAANDGYAMVDLEGDGKVLNIQCWNDEFARRLKDHYPGYKVNDENDALAGGQIGDIEVNFILTPSAEDAYQKNLSEVLKSNSNQEVDDRTDMFLVEADYALKYVNTDIVLPVSELGINVDTELSNQYQYTKDIVTDESGRLKGVSWQACPGVMIYNRDAAKKVFGSDDPETVQTYVNSWYEFNQTAELMKQAGYRMTSSANDTYRVFSNNVSAPWVEDGKIRVDDNIKKWVDMSKEQVDKGYTGTADLWSDDWSKGFSMDGDVFAYFGPAWLINFSMGNVNNGENPDDGSRTFQGGWAATEGPQSFYWGGTWICASSDTDNSKVIADIMRKLTVDNTIMTDIVKQDNDFVNNKPAMTAAVNDSSFSFKPLGDQNPIGLFVEGADDIDLSNLSEYDQGCNESFQNSMKDYFVGNVSYEEALDLFYKSATEKYPELSY